MHEPELQDVLRRNRRAYIYIYIVLMHDRVCSCACVKTRVLYINYYALLQRTSSVPVICSATLLVVSSCSCTFAVGMVRARSVYLDKKIFNLGIRNSNIHTLVFCISFFKLLKLQFYTSGV